MGLPGLFVRRMVKLSLPKWLFTLIAIVSRHIDVRPKFWCAEFYAGKATVQSAFVERGYEAVAMDKEYDSVGNAGSTKEGKPTVPSLSQDLSKPAFGAS